MGELASILLSPEERTEAPLPASAPAPVEAPVAPETAPKEKTGKPKTTEPVFRKPEPKKETTPKIAEIVEVDRPYGERGDFEKVTVTLPSDVRAMLLEESLRRKMKRSPDWPIAAIVREAIASYLNGKR